MASSFVNNLVSGNLANSPSNPIYAATHAAPAAPKAVGYFWKGADGKVYVQGSNGINAAGNWDANSAAYWGGKGFVHTPDSPAARAAATNGGGNGGGDTSAAYGSGGGGGGGTAAATKYDDRTADIDVNQRGYDSVDSQVNAGIGTIDKSLGSIMAGYETEANNNEGDYTTSSTTNQNNLQKNKQSAMINAAHGRQGLFGTLASLGALNGDGIDLANDAVQKGANEDLSNATDTYSQNQTALEASIKKFRDADKARRDAANNEAENEKRSVRGQGAKDRQTYLQRMSDDYRAEGKNADADRYAKMVGDLFPEIAAGNVPTSSLAPTAAAYTPTTLANYLASANGTTVQATPNQSGGFTGLPGLIASNKKQQQ